MSTPSPRLSPSTSLPPGTERRSHARHAVVQDQIVAIAFQGDNGGLILDVSQHGCAVQTVGPLESGGTTEFDFVLPNTGKRLRGRAQVRWAEKSGRSGLRFLEFSRGSLADLTAWLARPSAFPVQAQPSAPPPAPNFEPSEMEAAIVGLQADDALAYLASRTREITRASGVAIAVGAADAMICRASVGAAPALGARLLANSGLSGECVRSRLLVRCDDTETDTRVDAAVCRQLDLRSAVLVPVLRQGEIIGVLEVFSNLPRAFGSIDIQRLSRTAELVHSILNGPTKQEPAGPATIPAAAAEPGVTPVADAVPAVVASPARPEPKAPPAAPVNAPMPVIVPRAIPRQNVRSRKLTRAERSALLATRQPTVSSTPEFASTEASSAIPRAAKIGFLTACAAMLILGGVLLRPRAATTPSTPSPAPVEHAAPTSPAPAAATAPEAAQPSPAPKPLSPEAAKPSAPATKPAKLDASDEPSTESVSLSAIRRPAAPSTDEVPAPPSLSAPSMPNLSAPNLVASRAPTPTLARPLSSNLVPGKLVHRVAPEYPPAAFAARVSGEVILQAVIRPDGTIGTVEVVSGNPILAQAAVAAVRQWRYEPYRLNGTPVEATANIRLAFKR